MIIIPDYLFRPYRFFFPAAAMLALSSVPLWLLMRAGSMPLPAMLTPMLWHAEEMLFGYAFAVIAGYLLPPMQLSGLSAIVALWLGARLVWFIPGLPNAIVLVVATAFPLVLAITGSKRFAAAKRNRNRVFAAIMLAMATAVLVLLVAGLVFDFHMMRSVVIITLYLIVLLIIVMGGRLIPAITVGALREQQPEIAIHAQPRREFACVILMTAFIVLELATMSSMGSGVSAWLLAVMLLWRMQDWTSLAIWRVAEIWPLHLAYVWIVVGLVLLGLARFGVLSDEVEALHALGAGGIGTITFAMMARLIRLRSKNKRAPAWLYLIHLCFAVAVLLRVFVPWIKSSETEIILWLSAYCWSISYAGLLLFFFTSGTSERQALVRRG